MNKTTKGSLAAGAAAVLLLGGAGSLAYWTDSASVDAGALNSGYLTLDEGTCDADWMHLNGPKKGTKLTTFVPGDVVTKKCRFVIGAQGDNLSAIPTIDGDLALTPQADDGSTPKVSGNGESLKPDAVQATYTLGGAPYNGTDAITEAAEDRVLEATIVVNFDYGNETTINANDTQNIVAKLDNLTVALKQANPNDVNSFVAPTTP